MTHGPICRLWWSLVVFGGLWWSLVVSMSATRGSWKFPFHRPRPLYSSGDGSGDSGNSGGGSGNNGDGSCSGGQHASDKGFEGRIKS